MPTSTTMQRFHLVADTGRTKVESGEWQYLQNVRGWGGRGRKRQGVQTVAKPTSGIMGFFDLENGAGTPDKVVVWLNSGSLLLYDWSELTTTFDYLMDGGNLILQSPDLDWWQVSPDAATGLLGILGVAAPSVTRSTDLVLGQDETFGFKQTAYVWRLFVPSTGFPTVRQYALAGGSATYTTDLAFSTGSGPVFTDEYLVRRRIEVANGGIIQTTEV